MGASDQSGRKSTRNMWQGDLAQTRSQWSFLEGDLTKWSRNFPLPHWLPRKFSRDVTLIRSLWNKLLDTNFGPQPFLLHFQAHLLLTCPMAVLSLWLWELLLKINLGCEFVSRTFVSWTISNSFPHTWSLNLSILGVIWAGVLLCGRDTEAPVCGVPCTEWPSQLSVP